MVQVLEDAMLATARDIEKWPRRRVRLFHHNDSDGLTSGAILTRAFERAGFEVRRSCLEKPYPKVLAKVFETENEVIVFADFAGRIAPMISELNAGRNLTVILDHHKANPATDPMVRNLDPELFGLKGDRDITASTTCYLFACQMDPDNRDLAPVAALGAVGDGFFVDGRLASENRKVAEEAARQGMLEITGTDDGEDYILKTARGPVRCAELGAYLDTLGGAGYYRNGPDMGIRVCLEGADEASDAMLKDLEATQERVFEDQIRRLTRGGELHSTSRIQWFQVGERFSPMGVKMIGVFCEMYRNADFFDPSRFIAGFQVIPNHIPGFGDIRFDEVKISMRVSDRLQADIQAGRVPGLDTFLPEATARLGGFSDACHSLTAATTVAIGKETALIEEMEKILSEA
jgi:hypothetical protein